MVALTAKRVLRAFTLIELLVVMTIIGLLLALALPRYFGSIDKSKETVLKENLRVTRTQLDRFFADRGRHAQSLEELVSEKYLRTVPVDPITESAETWILVQADDPDAPGIADLHSGARGQARDGTPYDAL
jgi:general secretion pathway protein G